MASKPRQGVAKQAAANKAVTRFLTKARQILSQRIDRLMVPFRTSAPEFYTEYKTARSIVDTRGTQERKTIVITADTNPVGLPKAA